MFCAFRFLCTEAFERKDAKPSSSAAHLRIKWISKGEAFFVNSTWTQNKNSMVYAGQNKRAMVDDRLVTLVVVEGEESLGWEGKWLENIGPKE
jgi:hypothetical protein